MDRKRILDKLQTQELRTASASYRVVRELGRGGNGVALLCTGAGVELVAKVYLPPDSRDLDDRAMERFKNEIALSSKLAHPNVIKAIDTGTLELGSYTLPFYLMQRASGTLRERVGADLDPDSVEAKLRLFARAAQGVAFLHHNGIIHRDLKPANILLDRSGNPLIADLGIAHVNPDFVTVGLRTVASERLLNRDYYAPEQRFGSAREVDSRSDIYALGCILYELLSAIPPVRVSIPDLATIAPVLAPIDQVWKRMTEWEPDRRYPSVEGALEDLLLASGAVIAAMRGTGGVRHPDLKRMTGALRSNNEVHRLQGVDLAARLGRVALDELHSLVGHGRREVRNAAAIALGRIADPESLPYLIALLYGTSRRASQFRPSADTAAAAVAQYSVELRSKALEQIARPVPPTQVLEAGRNLSPTYLYDLLEDLDRKQLLLLDWSDSILGWLVDLDEERAWPAIRAFAKSGKKDFELRPLLGKLGVAHRVEAVSLWVSRGTDYSFYVDSLIAAVDVLPISEPRRVDLLAAVEERVRSMRTTPETRQQHLSAIHAARDRTA